MTGRGLFTRRAVLRSGGALALGATALARSAAAAGYPDRPVRLVAPFAAGGPSDTLARLLSVKLGEALGGFFYVENRPGAGSNIGTSAVARATPDGYTLLLTSSAFVLNPGLYKQVPYDPVKDFAPIAELVTSPNVFIATPRIRNHLDGGTGGARQGKAGYAELCQRRDRHHAASRRRMAEIHRRHQDHAHPLWRRRTGAAGDPVRHRAARLRLAAGRASLDPEPRCPRAGGHRFGTLVRSARRADHDRTRLQGFHLRHLPRHAGAGRARRRTSSSGSPRYCWKPCASRHSTSSCVRSASR